MIDCPTRKDLKAVLKHVISVNRSKEELENQRVKRDRYNERNKDKIKERKAQEQKSKGIKYCSYSQKNVFQKSNYQEYQEDYKAKQNPLESDNLLLEDIYGNSHTFFYVDGPSSPQMKKALVSAIEYFSGKKLVAIFAHHFKNQGVGKIAYIELTTESKGFVFNLKHPTAEVSILLALKQIFESKSIMKIGYNLKQFFENLKDLDSGISIHFKNTHSIEDLLFCCKTSGILNLPKICFRFFGKHLTFEKMKNLCEKETLDFEDKKNLMINAVAIFKMTKDLDLGSLVGKTPLKTPDQLFNLKVDKSWKFVLDITCPCIAAYLQDNDFDYEQLTEQTYSSSDI